MSKIIAIFESFAKAHNKNKKLFKTINITAREPHAIKPHLMLKSECNPKQNPKETHG